jgi:TonB family protein
MAFAVTSEFVKASNRATVPPFSLIEHKGLLSRLIEEVARSFSELTHDPVGFLRDSFSAEKKDEKRRRLIYLGLLFGLVAHVAFAIVIVIAGWHRVMAIDEDPRPEPPLVLKGFVSPGSSVDHETGGGGDALKNNGKGSSGGGQQDNLPPVRGNPPPTAPRPPLVSITPSQVQDPTLPIPYALQGQVGPPPPPGQVGDPNSKSEQLSGGPGTGGGVGTGTGGGLGSGNQPGTNREGGSVGGSRGPQDGSNGQISGVPFNRISTIEGFTPFSWIRRVTPVITPEAQAAKVSGTVFVIATFRADGTITDIEIRNTVDYMTESAIAALKQSRFRPAKINGVPITLYRVPVKIEVTVNER